MNIRQLKYILAVAEVKNFIKAAELCHVTQSTLSTMIAKFENEIGIKVFDRKTKPISITKEGKNIIEQFVNITKEFEIFDELIQTLKGELYGEITIGIIPTVAPYILPVILKSYAEKFPKITFSVVEMNTDKIIKSIEKRGLDIGILALPLENEGLTETKLYNESFVLFDCTNGPKKPIVSIKDIKFDKFCYLKDGHCFQKQVDNICDYKNDAKEKYNFNFKAGSIDSLIRFVKKNKGVTMLPELATLDFSAPDIKKISKILSPQPVRTIGMVVHKHFVKKKIVNTFVEEIKDKIIPLIHQSRKDKIVISPL